MTVEYPDAYDRKLKFSIITASYNRKALIKIAINSVMDQDYDNFEHLIMDGGSDDGTVEMLQQYEHITVTSEKDDGVYDAWNKGIKKSSGDVIGFLNSDDYYSSGIFSRIADLFHQHPEVDAIVGAARLFRDTSSGEESLVEYQPVSQNNLFANIYSGAIIPNAWFIKKDVFHQTGLFSNEYKYSSDCDFIIRFGIHNLIILPAHFPVYNYRFHPDSLTYNDDVDTKYLLFLERYKIAKKYLRDLLDNPKDRNYVKMLYSFSLYKLLVSPSKYKSTSNLVKFLMSSFIDHPLWPLTAVKIRMQQMKSNIR